MNVKKLQFVQRKSLQDYVDLNGMRVSEEILRDVYPREEKSQRECERWVSPLHRLLRDRMFSLNILLFWGQN